MTRLVDTTLRLLSQDPLAGHLGAARLLAIAERLDGVGYAGLEVTGGGAFASMVNRAVESPWERIRALKDRAPQTPLVMALRGSFLVGPRPADPELVRLFILCAAESGIDVFRLHDPLNDVEDLEVPAAAVREAGAQLYAGLVYAAESADTLVERARALAALGADRVLLHDPAGALDPAAAGSLIERLRGAAGVPVGLYTQGPGGTALAAAIEAARAGADPIATTSYPVAMLTHRAATEQLTQALRGLGVDPGIDLDAAWAVAREIETGLGDAAASAPPVSPQVALRSALTKVPVGLIAGLERSLRAVGAGDRLDEVLDEVLRVRVESGSPPPASPVGRLLASQAIQHVLSARRWASVDEEMRRLLVGDYGKPPFPVDPAARAVADATAPRGDRDPNLDDARALVGDLAASDEDLCLVALFGERAMPLLATLRGRALPGADESLDESESARIRRLTQVLENSSLAELTVEESGVRITLRKSEPQPTVAYAPPLLPVPGAPPAGASGNGAPAAPEEPTIRVESPMVGTFYRSAAPGAPPFVEEGDQVEVGQTLCVLEAMKLFNELKSEHAGTVRRICAENAELVEFGQPLFELAP